MKRERMALDLASLRAKYIADFRAQADSLEIAREGLSGLLNDSWVVVMPHDIGVRFTMEGNRVSNPKPTTALMATRFSLNEAIRISHTVQNGNGERATAMHVKTLLERQIDGLRKSADDVERTAPTSLE
jgi:hypothetical protein